MARPIPPSLAKRGITQVTDNLQPGQEVNWVKPLFWVFREELEARLLKPVRLSADGPSAESTDQE